MGEQPVLRQRLQSLLATDPPRSKSLLVTILGDSITPHGGTVMLAGLIKLLVPFAINHRLVRTNVHRLQHDGWLVSRRQGRLSAYALTPQGLRRFTNAYKRVYAPPEQFWDGSWTLVSFPIAGNDPAIRKDQIQELAWEGFGAMAPSIFVHPRANAATLREILSSTKKEEVFVLQGRILEQLSTVSQREFVHRCWDLESLAKGYQSFLNRFQPIAAMGELRGMATDDAFVLRTLLIHHFRRVTLHDPLLPIELLPEDWPGYVAYEFCRTLYKRSYRRAELFLRESLDTPESRLPDEAPHFHERFGGLD
jgi:phenylacetic acid degradation operon negative regulatory protein